MNKFDFLVEIGTEELPPKALKTLSDAFEASLIASIDEKNLTHGSVTSYAAPRRLAIWIKDLAEVQADETFERRGPAIQAAFDVNGKPSKAAMGFARGCGIDVNQLDQLETEKGSWLVHRGTKPGEKSVSLLPDLVKNALDALPIPKRMRWGANRHEFVRPLQWIVMMADHDVIPCEIMGIQSGNETRGHRFHSTAPVVISKPANYAKELKEQGMVIASFYERRDYILQSATDLALAKGLKVVISDDLLNEVAGLSEWPVALSAQFEERFLDVPAEALISSMEEHQKYFPVVNDAGEIQPHFIFIANIESKDPAQVISGNEKVIRPRLADAAFFWETDKKQTLASRVEKLDSVMFQKELGSIGDKVRRIGESAGQIARLLNFDETNARRAAKLAKTDLLTDMVFEFTDLQGIAGSYYAKNDGEVDEVAAGIREHYLPAGAGDELPASNAGIAVALADRLDNLTGLFGIGQPPTGNRDPFALRRAALGILRILVEKQLDLDLPTLIKLALSQHNFSQEVSDKTLSQVTEYLLDRFGAWYSDEGIAPGVIMAVRNNNISHPMDFDLRVKAVHSFNALPESESLAAANKRVGNLLSKTDSSDIQSAVNADLLVELAEKELANKLEQCRKNIAPLVVKRSYQDCLTELSTLRSEVDNFFDQVMVMADDEAIRKNRLTLLSQLRALFLQVADISHLS